MAVAGDSSHYRILSRLGCGGMGEVFLAEDVLLNRKVALKFLLADPGDDTADRRLLREARAIAHLDHPFICKVYEAGEHDRRPYLAMEYVEGVTLKERLASGRLPASDALRVCTEVAEALNFAHTRGVVHRDLKPANVMLGPDGHVKVMDFGIAKRMPAAVGADGTTADVATATIPGHTTGTLAYMSPEQIRGEPVDGRSDVFAFGVLLHEVLTGQHPFMRGSLLETASAILNDTPQPIEQTAAGTPSLLAHIVARCLQKDRGRRYQSLGDVRLELEALSGAPVAASPRPARRALITAAVVVSLLALISVVHWVRPLPFLAPEPALAFSERDLIIVSDFNNLTNDPVFDGSLRLALGVSLSQSQYVNVYPQDRVEATLRRMQRKPSERLDDGLAAEIAVRDGVRGVLACDIAKLDAVYSITARLLDPRTLATVFTDSMQAGSKGEVLSALDRLATRVRSALGESLARLSERAHALPQATTASLDALKAYADSLRLNAPRDEDASFALLRQAVELDPEFALAHAALGRHYYLSAEPARRALGEKHYVTALALTDRLTLRERLWIQASAWDSRGNREQAVYAYKAYVAQYPDDAAAWFRLAWTEMAGLQRYRDAIEHFERVIALNPTEAGAFVNIATSYAGLREYDKALPAYEKAFELSPDMVLGVFINHEYGFTLVRTGRLDEAAALFERMKNEAPQSNRARGYRSSAFLRMSRGEYTSALAELRRAIALNQAQKFAVSEYRDRLILYNALQALGRTREAAAEWPAIERLIRTHTLSPDWLWRPVQILARQSRTEEAMHAIARMQKTVWLSTAGSAANRNTASDQAYIDLAQAHIELAAGRSPSALELLERTHLTINEPDALASLAGALAAAGRIDEAIRRYEELLHDPPLGREAQQSWFDAHLALGQLYEQQGKSMDARRLYSSLLSRWEHADEELRLLQEVRKRIAMLPVAQ